MTKLQLINHGFFLKKDWIHRDLYEQPTTWNMNGAECDTQYDSYIKQDYITWHIKNGQMAGLLDSYADTWADFYFSFVFHVLIFLSDADITGTSGPKKGPFSNVSRPKTFC